MTRLETMILRHEGIKVKPYKDTKGKLTIGVGRNLDERGISQDEAFYLLSGDLRLARYDAAKFLWFKDLDEVRQDVIISMIFNMGLPVFNGFKDLCKAMVTKDYVAAKSAMLNSEWAGQVKGRAVELASMMESGEYLG